MALSTYTQLWRGVLQRCPLAGPFLAQDWVRWSFRRIIEKRKWSWSIKRAQFLFFNQYTTGNVDVTFQSNTVQGHGTGWTSTLIGRQFRIGLLTPIYTIIAVDAITQTLTLDDLWGGPTTTATGYQIYLAYALPPTDFHSLISIWDPQFNWQIWTTIRQEDLNSYDGQRATQGTAWVCADFDYTSIQLGGATISPALPRFEIWPHQVVQKPLPFLYEARMPDLDDSGAALPRYIPGNVLMEGALAQCARWPGPDREHPNPYFNLSLSQIHEGAFEKQLAELERQDDEVYVRDVEYGRILGMPFAPLPFPINSSYLQTHAI